MMEEQERLDRGESPTVEVWAFVESRLFWVCLKMVSTPKPNGFADHYPVFKLLFHWEYIYPIFRQPFCFLEQANFGE